MNNVPTLKPVLNQPLASSPSHGAAHVTPVVLTVQEACKALRVSRWSLYQLVRANEIGTIKIGARRVVPLISIHSFISRRLSRGAV